MCRIQLSPNFSLTPDLQWLKKTANLKETDSNWAFALRAILTI
ncbi:carbohydrate porin [Thalassotalea sp. PS06]|nr:carbohydrate porin [Thalassotalea sp. PS06]